MSPKGKSNTLRNTGSASSTSPLYPLAGATDGRKTLGDIGKKEVFGAMKRDLGKLRGYRAQAWL